MENKEAINKSLITNIQRLDSLINKNEQKIKEVIPSSINKNRLISIFRREFVKNPKLSECSIESIQDSLIRCCQLGLEPGSLEHIYLIPRGNQCTTMIGYKGMIELAYRSERICSIVSNAYYDSDEISIVLGTEQSIRHIPNYLENRNISGFYAIVSLKDGSKIIEHKFKKEIDDIRDKSQSYAYWIMNGKKGNKPIWEQYYESMGKKTVLRSIFKIIPFSVDIKEAILQDEINEYGHLYENESSKKEEVSDGSSSIQEEKILKSDKILDIL